MRGFEGIEGLEWDEGNRDKNLYSHNVENEEAEEIFFNVPLVIFEDDKHSTDEARYQVLGATNDQRELCLVYTLRKNKIRIISARDMNKKERNFYYEKTKNTA